MSHKEIGEAELTHKPRRGRPPGSGAQRVDHQAERPEPPNENVRLANIAARCPARLDCGLLQGAGRCDDCRGEVDQGNTLGLPTAESIFVAGEKPCGCMPVDVLVPDGERACGLDAGGLLVDGAYCEKRHRMADMGDRLGLGVPEATAKERAEHMVDEAMRDRDQVARAARQYGKFAGFTEAEHALVAGGLATIKKWWCALPGSRTEREALAEVVDLAETVTKQIFA